MGDGVAVKTSEGLAEGVETTDGEGVKVMPGDVVGETDSEGIKVRDGEGVKVMLVEGVTLALGVGVGDGVKQPKKIKKVNKTNVVLNNLFI